jgi:hypothetical protein
MSRPRDVIYLVKEAVAVALNRGHAVVEPEDWLAARENYSRFVFGSILAEDDPQRNLMEEVLFEFAGAGHTLSEVEVFSRISKAGVAPVDIGFYVNLLCDVNFLGIRTIDGYVFPEDENDREMRLEIARRLLAGGAWPDDELFQVSPAFYQVLQIE